MAGALPNLLIIGVAKCGTTALHRFLDLHPGVAMSDPKELNFFAADADLECSGLPALERSLLPRTRNWGIRDLDWYRSKFDPAATIRGESSVAYGSPWHRQAAARVESLLPDVRIILCVRDPVARMRSQLADNQSKGIERRPAREAFGADANTYLARSAFGTLIEPWLEAFDRSRLLVVRAPDLRRDPATEMARVHEFCGLEPFVSDLYDRTHNSSAEKGRRAAALSRLQRRRGARILARSGTSAGRMLEAATRSRRAELPALGLELVADLRSRLEPEMARFEELTGVRPPTEAVA